MMTIKIHQTAKVSSFADIEESNRGTLIEIGPSVVIDSFVKIKPAGGNGDILVGEGSIINSGCVLYTGNGISIGKNVLIAANTTLAPTNHSYADPTRYIRDQGFQQSRGGIIIEDDVWIGAGCVLLDGAYVPAGCVIAAGTVIRSRLPEPMAIYAGNPPRVIKKR